MFLSRNKKNVYTFWLKKVPFQELWSALRHGKKCLQAYKDNEGPDQPLLLLSTNRIIGYYRMFQWRAQCLYETLCICKMMWIPTIGACMKALFCLARPNYCFMSHLDRKKWNISYISRTYIHIPGLVYNEKDISSPSVSRTTYNEKDNNSPYRYVSRTERVQILCFKSSPPPLIPITLPHQPLKRELLFPC